MELKCYSVPETLTNGGGHHGAGAQTSKGGGQQTEAFLWYSTVTRRLVLPVLGKLQNGNTAGIGMNCYCQSRETFTLIGRRSNRKICRKRVPFPSLLGF